MLRDQRVRILLTLALLVVIGFAVYRVGATVWTSRQFVAATQALDRYDYLEAEQILDRLLWFQPTDQPALVLAAQTARRSNKFVDASRRLRLAAEKGVSRDAIELEARLLEIQSGDLSDADRLAQVCTDEPDGPAAALFLEALIEGSFRSLNLPLARWGVDLWLAHRQGPFEQAKGLLWRGRISEFMQDFPQAAADYQKAAALAPEFWPARVRLVEALLRDDPRQATTHLESLRRDRPDDPEVRFLTARLCRSIGQPEEAARSLDAILTTDPDNIAYLVERVRVAIDLNQAKHADRLVTHALERAPQLREVNLAAADVMRKSGRLGEAKQYQDKVQAIDVRLNKRLQEMTKSGTNKK